MKGCKKFNKTDMPDDFYKDPDSDMAPMVMVERGECSFVTKVRNIEAIGGVKLAIIIDNKEEDTQNLIMADDGTGQSIHIPSFIITKKDGDNIKETITKSKQIVYIKAELEMVHPDNRVEYEFWYSTILDMKPDSLEDIALYQSALNDNALFTPRIVSYSCDYCSDEVKKSSCLVNGSYCAYMPKQKLPKELNDISGS